MLQTTVETINLTTDIEPVVQTKEKTENNVKLFFKNSKTLLFWMHLITFIAFLAITVALNEPVRKIAYHFIGSHFVSFQWKGWFERLFEYSFFNNLINGTGISKHENLFVNYQVTLLGAFIVLTVDLGFLLFDFVERRKRLKFYQSNIGVYMYPHMDKWCKDVIKSIIDCATYLMKTALCWLFLSFVIFTSLISGNIFEHNFFLCALQFAFAIWMFTALLIMYNYYDWYTEYYLSFVKFPRYEDSKEGISCLLPKVIGESLLTLLSLFVILVSLPYDLTLIYLFFKHFASRRKFKYTERTRSNQIPEVPMMLA